MVRDRHRNPCGSRDKLELQIEVRSNEINNSGSRSFVEHAGKSAIDRMRPDLVGRGPGMSKAFPWLRFTLVILATSGGTALVVLAEYTSGLNH